MESMLHFQTLVMLRFVNFSSNDFFFFFCLTCYDCYYLNCHIYYFVSL